MVPTEISKEDLNNLDQIKFTGEIVLISNPELVAEAVFDLMTHKIIGFDTETRPSFSKGESYPTALIQLSSEKKVYIFQLQKTGFTNELTDFLEYPNIIKVGVGVDDDHRQLRKIKEYTPAGFVDLSKTAKNEFNIKNPGLRTLSALFLGLRVSKREQRSNWEKEPLTPSQLSYAATDAWICLRIFDEMNKRKPL